MHIKYLYDKKTGLFYHGWTFDENTTLEKSSVAEETAGLHLAFWNI